jgi:hypothetical protein
MRDVRGLLNKTYAHMFQPKNENLFLMQGLVNPSIEVKGLV